MPSKEFHESREEIEKILKEEKIGYLGLSMDGLPYVVPLNYAYVEGKILFHCGFAGKKLDYLRANPRICFSVGRQSGRLGRHPRGARCPTEADSVICYGRARIVADAEERKRILDVFNRSLQPDAEEIPREAAERCCCVEITITEMTGRSQRAGMALTYWRYAFGKTGEER